jgi:type VII secretion protein EccE
VTLRRLADHLRELGYQVATTDVDIPELAGPEARERWRAISDGDRGFLTCYAVPADGGLDQTLDELRSTVGTEVWTAVELTGSPANPDITAVCAVRSEQAPSAAPLPNLRPLRGRQRSVLAALHPESSRLLTVRT